MKRSPLRGLALGLFVAVAGFGNFSRLPGGECIRAIHIVNLIVCGMGLGVALMSGIMMLRTKKTGEH